MRAAPVGNGKLKRVLGTERSNVESGRSETLPSIALHQESTTEAEDTYVTMNKSEEYL